MGIKTWTEKREQEARFLWGMKALWVGEDRSEEKGMADKTDAYELKEAEEHWEEIMERVEAGEEIVLLRDGVAVAKLVSLGETAFITALD